MAQSQTQVTEKYQDGHIYRRYHVVFTEVVDTVLTEDLDTGEQAIYISPPTMRRCPHGAFEEYDKYGFLVAKGNFEYTYGASMRVGEWGFYVRGKLIRTENYIIPGYAYFEHDPGCSSLE